MTTNNPRLRIASGPTASSRYAHLQPIVEAELGWGNEAGRHRDWYQIDPIHDAGNWTFDFVRPFHLEQLRATFMFPDTIRLSVSVSQAGTPLWMTIGDGNRVGITAPCPRDWAGGEGVFLPLPRTDGEDR